MFTIWLYEDLYIWCSQIGNKRVENREHGVSDVDEDTYLA